MLIIYSFLVLRGIPWYGYTSLLNHSLTEGNVGCFQFGAMMNKAAMNIGVQVFV